MFDQILQLVKEHVGNNPQIAAAIPPGQEEAVHNEIATHIANTLATQPVASNGGILSSLENSIASGGPVVSAIEGSLISSLTSKFGLSPSITGAISGALPGLLQKFANRSAGSK
ncbi:MAG: hypothetical protein ABJB86_00340 [Bacteroidota bacterium]